MKNKTKLKLVEEYIFLKKVEDFCKKMNTECDFFSKKVEKLLTIYKKILFKYGFFNLSLAILQKELEQNDLSVFDANFLKYRLDEIETNIFLFIKKCRLNEFEKRYVIE